MSFVQDAHFRVAVIVRVKSTPRVEHSVEYRLTLPVALQAVDSKYLLIIQLYPGGTLGNAACK